MIKKFFFAAAIALTAITGNAQSLPNDPATRVGKLDNGLTYYIRHNEKPAQRAEFYLATNVGALQELPDQDGLAHFLEHMCFNGTKNFPDKELLNWLESIGASFGGNVNASTGVEETIYNLSNIPLIRPTVVDSCILIMHDYSHFVTNDPVEIDKERGVILEEKRYRNTAGRRMLLARYKYFFNNTKYGETSVIGTEEQLKTFKPESLTNFYHTWYRPDNQALIVVGDVDVDYVEACIQRTFADIPAPETPLEKELIPIPDNEKPLIGILTDPENSEEAIIAFWRSPATPEEINSTPQGLLLDVMTGIVSRVMNERFSDLLAKPDAPFVSGGFGIGNIGETADIVLINAVSKKGTALQGLAAALLEAEKLRRFGLTDAEVERAKTELLSQYEMAANKAETRSNGEFIQPMIDNFFDNQYFMDPQTEYTFVQQIMPALTADVVNQLAKKLITRENMGVIYQGIDQEGEVHPTEEQIQAVIDAVENAQLEQAAGEDIPTEFLDASQLKGSKAGKVTEGIYGSKYFTLKNGVRVWLLPTAYEKDRIIFDFSKDGGRSLIADEDLYSFDPDSWALYKNNAGVAEFPATLLRKMQAGKQIAIDTYIYDYSHGITGVSTVKDLEETMQLAYLYYTQPRFDETEYNQGRKRLEAILPNLDNQPEYKFRLAKYAQLFDSPRRFFLSQETFDKGSMATMERVYKNLFKDAAGARLVVVGDFDPDDIMPMICKYFGSIEKGKKATVAAYRGDGVSSASKLYDFQVAMPTNKMVKVLQHYNLVKDYDVNEEAAMDALRYILFNIYTETLREDEGGTYGADVNCDVEFAPDARHSLDVGFQTNVESADKLRDLAKSGLQGIADNGPTADQFDKAVKNLQKRIPENRQHNNYWVNVIVDSDRYGLNYDKDYEDAVNALTPEKVQAVAQQILKGNLIEIVMRPE